MQVLDWQGLFATLGLAAIFLVAWKLRDFHYEPPGELLSRDEPPEPAPPRGDAETRSRGGRPARRDDAPRIDPLDESGAAEDGLPPELADGEEGDEATDYLPDLGDDATPFERCLVGWCFINGIDVPWDLEEVACWIREEAERGHPEARYVYALCLRRGDGVPRNDREARKWLRLAAPDVPEAADLLRDAYGEEPPPPRANPG